MFEMAARRKFRFPYKGMVSVEDLWDLDVGKLDQIYKSLNALVKKASEDSLLSTKTQEDEELSVKIAIVKYIVSVKLQEETDRKLAATRLIQRKRIMEVMASKEDAALQNKSPEELQAMLKELGE